MRIGILLAGHLSGDMLSTYGDVDKVLSDMLQDQSFTITTYAVCDGQFPESVDSEQGWLVSGSINCANDELPWIHSLKGFIKKIYQQEVPLVGICFGHQVIASALGGKVEKYQGGWGVGNHQYQISANDLALRVIAWHQDQVVEKPTDAQCIGSSDFCQFAFLVYGQCVFTMQPHPEFSTQFAKDLLIAKAADFDQQTIQDVTQSLVHSLDSAVVVTAIANFYRTQTVTLK